MSQSYKTFDNRAIPTEKLEVKDFIAFSDEFLYVIETNEFS